jgi:hypothetical protein
MQVTLKFQGTNDSMSCDVQLRYPGLVNCHAEQWPRKSNGLTALTRLVNILSTQQGRDYKV